MHAAPPILPRLDAALHKARWRDLQVRWLYLSEEDWEQFDSEMSERHGFKLHAFSYRNIQIRRGKRSRLTSNYGEMITIPRRLSVKAEPETPTLEIAA